MAQKVNRTRKNKINIRCTSEEYQLISENFLASHMKKFRRFFIQVLQQAVLFEFTFETMEEQIEYLRKVGQNFYEAIQFSMQYYSQQKEIMPKVSQALKDNSKLLNRWINTTSVRNKYRYDIEQQQKMNKTFTVALTAEEFNFVNEKFKRSQFNSRNDFLKTILINYKVFVEKPLPLKRMTFQIKRMLSNARQYERFAQERMEKQDWETNSLYTEQIKLLENQVLKNLTLINQLENNFPKNKTYKEVRKVEKRTKDIWQPQND